eukprot:8487061-Pyramimonas_sp.AAC.1
MGPDGWPVDHFQQQLTQLSRDTLTSTFGILRLVDETICYLVSLSGRRMAQEYWEPTLHALLSFRHQF